jgi:hypothetical protein
MTTIQTTGSDLVARLLDETLVAWARLADAHEPGGHRCDDHMTRQRCAPRRMAEQQLAAA